MFILASIIVIGSILLYCYQERSREIHYALGMAQFSTYHYYVSLGYIDKQLINSYVDEVMESYSYWSLFLDLEHKGLDLFPDLFARADLVALTDD